MIDEGTEFGARVARHLRSDPVVWLTTVSPAGAPVPSPVWFVWDGGDGIRLHSLPSARVRNIRVNPRVALNFAGDEHGNDIVVLSGRARVDASLPPADADEPYLVKYAAHIERIGYTAETFAQSFSVPIRVRLTRVRGH